MGLKPASFGGFPEEKEIAKLLRYRESVYRSIREAVMSYFDVFFNSMGQKTMRIYSFPLDLSHLDKRNWMMTDED